MDWQAIQLTIKLAACTTLVLMCVALPLAAWIAYSRRRFGPGVAEAIVALPLVLPPTVLGYYTLVALGPNSPLGQAFIAVFGTTLPFTFWGLLIASVAYSLPFAVQPLISSFRAVDHKLLEASACLGAGRFETFGRVIVPMARPGVVAAIVLSFVHTIGEFGVVLMVGGSIAGETRTVSIAIYDHVQELNYSAANQTALVLLVFSFAVLFLLYGLKLPGVHVGRK